ncbi:MAG: hypothetical protein IJ711_05420 [Lachnospiraceae bacterium]|nr:hypothetical protein [Lachnospiraceae bacterium]
MNTQRERVKRALVTAVFSFMAVMFMFAVTPIYTEAAAKKVSAAADYNKAPALKSGSNKVTVKTNYSYVKFTAVKAGTYRFQISNLETINGETPDYNLGNLSVNFKVKQKNNWVLQPQMLKTNGGKNKALYVTTKEGMKRYNKKNNREKDSYLTSRYGELKLKKGDTVYLKYFYTSPRGTYNIEIKGN